MRMYFGNQENSPSERIGYFLGLQMRMMSHAIVNHIFDYATERIEFFDFVIGDGI